MLDIGGIVALVVLAVLMYASYWIIRLAVKHGIEDSRRYPPADLRHPDAEQR
jgi:hypothetical protein